MEKDNYKQLEQDLEENKVGSRDYAERLYNLEGFDGIAFRQLLEEIEFDLHSGRKQEKLMIFIKKMISSQKQELVERIEKLKPKNESLFNIGSEFATPREYQFADTEADARAKMLIYLIEKGLITL